MIRILNPFVRMVARAPPLYKQSVAAFLTIVALLVIPARAACGAEQGERRTEG
jgi:hypothetical protein